MRRRSKLLAAISLLIALCPVVASQHTTASAKSANLCFGAACNGQSPGNQGCLYGDQALGSPSSWTGNGVTIRVQVYFSDNSYGHCYAKWAHVVVTSGGSVSLYGRVGDGSSYYDGYSSAPTTTYDSPMITAEHPAFACSGIDGVSNSGSCTSSY